MDDHSLFSEVHTLLLRHSVHRIIGIGPRISYHANVFSGLEAQFFQSTDNFLKAIGKLMFINETILIKGARKFAFEKIESALSEQLHRTVLEIDLDAMIHNFKLYKSFIKPKTKMMVMVKALSYGSGGVEVAGLMQFHGADYLAVAYADEGFDLRDAGIKLPIMVMNTDPESFHGMLTNQLEPELYGLGILYRLIDWIRANEWDQEVGIHVNIDTGMNRLGFNPSELQRLLQVIQEHPIIKIKSVYTHLVGSEDPDLKDFTVSQLQQFEACCNVLSEGLDYPFLRHALNTAAIVNFPDYQFDMVRLGIGLHGFDSAHRIQAHLKPVSTLRTVISQIREVDTQQTVGYNRKGVLHRASRIGILAIGYADGVSRLMGNGSANFWLNGHKIKTVGNICMDMCMVDITDVDAKEGDIVEIFGSNNPIEEVAAAAMTIPYEILTSVSSRVKRVFVKE
jgi:alanine racemase